MQTPLIDIRPDHWAIVSEILQKHLPQYEVWAFGSRAKWSAKEYSDLDLAVITDKPLSMSLSAALSDDFSESDLPWKVDIVDWASTSSSFRKIIEQDKVVLQSANLNQDVSADWHDVSLGELFRVKHGFAFKGEYFTDEPKPTILVTPGNFAIGGGFQDEKRKYYSGPVPEDYVLRPGQIVVTMTDLSKKSDTLGHAARIPQDKSTWLHNQRVGLLVFNTDPPNEPRFVEYLLRSHDYRSWVVGSATGTTVKHTSPSRIQGYKTRLPPLAEQRAIAHILGSLDDKIELNRRMNETLEALARAIFKSWFVDFDPVRAKASGEAPESICRRLGLTPDLLAFFPGRLVDSEIGEIPEGWGSEYLEQLSSYLNRGLSPKYIEEGGVLVLNQKCVRGGHVDPSKGRRHDPTQRTVEGRMIEIGDILVNSTGVGTLGRVAQVLATDEPTIVDSHITVVRVAPEKVSWNYLGITMLERQSEIEALGEGSTGQTELSRVRLGALRILLPPKPLRDHFDDCVIGLRQRAMSNNVQSVTLSMTRDALLPKLLSGELRVPVAGAA